MPLITIDIIPDPHLSRTQVIRVRRGEDIIGMWPCGTPQQGESEVLGDIEKWIAQRMQEHS